MGAAASAHPVIVFYGESSSKQSKYLALLPHNRPPTSQTAVLQAKAGATLLTLTRLDPKKMGRTCRANGGRVAGAK